MNAYSIMRTSGRLGRWLVAALIVLFNSLAAGPRLSSVAAAAPHPATRWGVHARSRSGVPQEEKMKVLKRMLLMLALLLPQATMTAQAAPLASVTCAQLCLTVPSTAGPWDPKLPGNQSFAYGWGDPGSFTYYGTPSTV